MRTWAFVTGAIWSMAPVRQWIASQYFQLEDEQKDKYRQRMADYYKSYDEMDMKKDEMLALFGF